MATCNYHRAVERVSRAYSSQPGYREVELERLDCTAWSRCPEDSPCDSVLRAREVDATLNQPSAEEIACWPGPENAPAEQTEGP